MNLNKTILLIISLILISGCINTNEKTIQIYAASSLTQVLNELIYEYNKFNNEFDISVSYAGSSTLRQQIQFGAKADIFISADEIQFEKLRNSKLIHASYYNLAQNKLAVITNNKNINNLSQLLTNDIKIAVGMNETPIGMYTNKLLDKLDLSNEYPSNYSDLFNTNVVSKERNVKVVASKIILNEIDVAVVYETDYFSIKDSNIYKIPVAKELNMLTSINGGIIQDSMNKYPAKDFLEYISSPESHFVWLKFNFLVVDCNC
jgi:molybdate transport system substrate-binding protein